MFYRRRSLKRFHISIISFILLALPASTTYEIHDFGFGSGGSSIIDSGNYSLNGITGEVSGSKNIGSTYNLGPGLEFTQQSNVSSAPTFTNAGNWYNKLNFIIDTGNNPSDTLFAIAISTDDFVTTNYIQADDTIGTSPVYQTYTNWGGASGENVIGLDPSTTYKIKTKAVQTKYTETEFSAAASATTDASTLSFDIDTSSSDTETAAPYSVDLGQLTVGSTTTATNRIWLDLDTNAESGGSIFIYDLNNGLTSALTGYTIAGYTGTLTSLTEGYGLRVSSFAASSGTMQVVSPFTSSILSIAAPSTTIQTILNSAGAPVSGGRVSIQVKAKPSGLAPAASDYTDTLTIVASGTF